MTGYYRMARGWMENDFFSPEPFTEREAWQWLIEQAAWRATSIRIKGHPVNLERGQLSFAQRFMAEKWGWSKSRVDRFMKRLVAENMVQTRSKIGAETGATAGHNAGQGQSILTICNYEKYQSPNGEVRGNVETQTGATAGQQRGKEEYREEDKKEKKEGDAKKTREPSDYAFFGRIIRLLPDDFDRWKKAYHAIPDITAELTSLDAWFRDQASDKQKKWFHTAAGALGRKHAEILKFKAADEWQPTVPL